jgi:pyruvate,orthophosphate dikinase
MKVPGADRRVDGEAANKRAERLVYGFSEDPGVEDGLVTLCGGKGAGLMRMRHLSLPVPEGFVITTEACAAYLGSGELPGGLMAQVMDHLERLEEATGRGFGDPENPLLVSVRSGAPVSMPGMMDTVLNLGLNDDTVHGLAKSTEDERFAQHSHRRFIQAFGEIVLKAPRHLFEDAIEEIKGERGVGADTELSAHDLEELVGRFKTIVAREVREEFPEDPNEQLALAIEAVFGSWLGERAAAYRKEYGIPESLGTAVTAQQMVFGNMGETSATRVAFTRDPSTGEQGIFGEFLLNA